VPADKHARPTADSGPPDGGPPDQENRTPPVRRGGLATLAANPRLPIWERRFAIALVAAIAVTLVFGWRIGVTVAVLVAISDTIYRSHSTARTRPTRNPAQRKTERNLEKLVTAGYVALNERAIPGSEAIIDHLVVGPTGVYAIDSERWDKRLPVRVIGGKQLFLGPFSQKERLDEARWEAARASELIDQTLGRRVDVRPSLAVWGPKIPWTILTVRNVDVFSAKRLRKYLRRSIKHGRGSPLDSKEIEKIYAAAARVLPARY